MHKKSKSFLLRGFMGYCLTLVLVIPLSFSQNVSILEKEKQKLVGFKYGQENFPKGYEYLGGHLIEKGPGMEYAVSHVRMDYLQFHWLEKLIHRDGKGKAYFEIKDVLLLPEIKKGEILVQGVCLYHGEIDPEIIAIVKYDKYEEIKRYLNVVLKAWKANCKKEIFEDLKSDNISCINEGL
jgi:hypothetical protein